MMTSDGIFRATFNNPATFTFASGAAKPSPHTPFTGTCPLPVNFDRNRKQPLSSTMRTLTDLQFLHEYAESARFPKCEAFVETRPALSLAPVANCTVRYKREALQPHSPAPLTLTDLG